jgi:hypothetical protein
MEKNLRLVRDIKYYFKQDNKNIEIDNVFKEFFIFNELPDFNHDQDLFSTAFGNSFSLLFEYFLNSLGFIDFNPYCFDLPAIKFREKSLYN